MALEGPAHALVRAWKDRGLRGAADVAAELVTAVVVPPVPGAVLVPVPALAARAAWRGGDGARALAERLADAWGGELAVPLAVTAHDRSVGSTAQLVGATRAPQFRAVAEVAGPVV